MTGEQRATAMELVRAALAAVDPDAAVRRTLSLDGHRVCVGQRWFDLGADGRVVLVGGGKASLPMVRAAEAVLGERIAGGQVITKHGHLEPPLPTRVELAEAGHPLPDVHSVQATLCMVAQLDGVTEQDLVLCLISGGGSALMTLPVPGVELAQLEQLNGLLLGAGAPIEAINAVRKHLSRIKGGQLAGLAAPARVASLILSDVVGNPLDVIASGPTAPDSSTFADALEVLRRYGVAQQAPSPVLEHLQRGGAGDLPDTPSQGDALFDRVHNVIIGSNELAADAAALRARELGLQTQVLSTFVQGEARQVGRVLAALLREEAARGRPLPRPACLVVGGETTVTLGHQSGKGGRNMELALSAAMDLQGVPDVLLVALATDGGDGPTDAGGALADGTTVARGEAAGLKALSHLDGHDAYPFFAALDDLLLLGPTGTNVNDLTLLLAF